MRTVRRTTTAPRRRAQLAAAALAGTLALTACSADAEPEETPSAMQEDDMAEEAPEEDMGAMLMPMSTGDPFADARTAAQHMPPTALTLATGLAAATGTEGDVASPAAELRAGLTALLQEHVYLAGYAVATAYVAGPDSAEFEAAAAVLDENSVDLADAVGSLAGDENREAFLTLDAVDDLERRAVERLVATDADAAAELAELRAVAARLGAAHETPAPPDVRDRVLAAVARTPQEVPADAPRPATRAGAGPHHGAPALTVI
ncbi:hypothetical protein GXB85_17050, partial [Cellulomonas sp. APG4]|nr:hypothetical protein [Cellulomonas sp. APG4]